jgi:hypothetical protein
MIGYYWSIFYKISKVYSSKFIKSKLKYIILFTKIIFKVRNLFVLLLLKKKNIGNDEESILIKKQKKIKYSKRLFNKKLISLFCL